MSFLLNCTLVRICCCEKTYNEDFEDSNNSNNYYRNNNDGAITNNNSSALIELTPISEVHDYENGNGNDGDGCESNTQVNDVNRRLTQRNKFCCSRSIPRQIYFGFKIAVAATLTLYLLVPFLYHVSPAIQRSLVFLPFGK